MESIRPSWKEPIALLGFGEEGKSSLRHLRRWGYEQIRVLDRATPSEAMPAGVTLQSGPDYLQGLVGARTAIRSPGLRPFVPEIAEFQARGGVLTSQVEAVFELLGRDRLIGVTGTLGKGTCCSLLSAMLRQGGVAHRLAGNIGLPPLDALENFGPKELLLLELSSFQLSTLRQSPHAAIVLKTTSEHLDWHATREEYWDHKANLTRFQQAGDRCVFFSDAEGSAWIGSQGKGRKTAVGRNGPVLLTAQDVEWPAHGFKLGLHEIRLRGAFNLENVAAAAALALELGVSPDAARIAAMGFQPLEHRLEFVREVGGISYYNDSYATRPEAALAAVKALRSGPLGLILGGSEKFADFGELAAGLAAEEHVRALALIGQTAGRLEAELKSAGTLQGRACRHCASLEEAMKFLGAEIPAGSILLSPACASFGLFANYKERGKAFKSWVNGLPSRP